MSKPRVVHVINGLYPGGAENMLLQLLTQAEHSGYEPIVVSLINGGPLEARVRERGIHVVSHGPKGRVPHPGAIPWLTRVLRETRPAVVQSWMYHSNILAGVAARAARNVPVVWGIHHTHLSPDFTKRGTTLVARAGAPLSSRLPASIVCCAEESRRVHAEIGYDKHRMLVIPNGFDLERFAPSATARAGIRAELGISPETPLVGMLARYNPQKDHHNFVQAARSVTNTMPETQFLLGGWDVTWENDELRGWIEEAGLRDRFHLLGNRSDTPAIHAALDAGCLSSRSGEAFPLVIGESMATGVPCAVTDIGDSAAIVGKLGRVAPPRDPEALAAGIIDLLSLSPEAKSELGLACRRSIEERFSLSEIARRYHELWDVVAMSHRGRIAA